MRCLGLMAKEYSQSKFQQTFMKPIILSLDSASSYYGIWLRRKKLGFVFRAVLGKTVYIEKYKLTGSS